jgi:murein hydrolase activator
MFFIRPIRLTGPIGPIAPLLFTLLLVASAPALGAQAPQDQLRRTRQSLREERSDLQQLKQQLQTEQRRVTQGKHRERSILTEIQAADQRLEEAEDRYAENQKNLALVQENLKNIRAAIAETETTLAEMRSLLADRLRLLYREGGRNLWQVLLTANTLSEALTRLKFFHTLAAQNAYWVERLSLTGRELIQKRLELAEREAQAQSLEAESLRDLERVKARKSEREAMLSRVRTERAEHEEALQELTAASSRLNDLITRLERKARDLERRAAEAERQKRLAAETARRAAGSKIPPATPQPTPVPWPRLRLVWPTRGRVTMLFGKVRHPRFNTFIYNKGIDIAGPIGQNVVAAASGRVLFAEWFEGYGRMVILDHGEGLNTVYAHLAKITVTEGQTVASNQVLGTLGDSGTWKGPVLYFEIRQRGEALDPLAYLR